MIPSDLPKPEMKGHLGIGQIILQAGTGFDQDILHDVADVKASLYLLVKPNLDQAMNSRAMPVEQLIDGGRISLLGGDQQLLGIIILRPK
jgi:hypothetical protein